MPYHGLHTDCDLRDLSWFPDANRGLLSRDGARFALELAQFSYDYRTAPWLSAGWTDISIQVDSHLLSGVRSMGEDRDWRQHILNMLVPRLARGLTVIANPVTEVRGALRGQVDHPTGKAVTMVLPGGNGICFVAIGFMGTGRRPQDWAGNMRLGHPDGFHEGFETIARQYEQNAGNIHFPAAARVLGFEKLTLADVLERCKKPGSPFRFVLAGHSQGAAVMQIWTHRRLMEGVLRENIAGFGYASPMAAVNMTEEERRCPLTHFLYSEDVFTRMGLREHLGRCFLLPADKGVRARCYGDDMNDPLFHIVLGLLNRQRDTAQALILCTGYLEALSQRPYKVIASSLSAFFESALMELPAIAEDWIARLMRLIRRSFRRYYFNAVGQEMPDEMVRDVFHEMDALMGEYGAVRLSRMLVRSLYLTHSLVSPDPDGIRPAPYLYLVNHAFRDILPMEQPGDIAVQADGSA